MQCEAFEQRLHQLLDRRRPVESDDRLLAHAYVCHSCRRLLDGQRLLLDVLQYGETPETEGDFSQRVVSRHVARERVERQRQRGASRFVRTVSTLAALALVALFVTAWLSGPGGELRDGSFVADTRANVGATDSHKDPSPFNLQDSAEALPTASNIAAVESVTPPAVEATDFELYHELFDVIQTASVDELVAAASPADSAIAELGAAGAGDDQVAMLLGDWRTRMAEIPSEPLDVEQIAGGLKPITEPFGAALDMLWESLPSEAPAVEKPQAGRPSTQGNSRFS